MTDLHTHILPGIDDGAIDEGVSSEQMKSLLEQGVDKVVFTSHYYGRKRSPKQFLEARADAFGRIKDLIPEGMETYLGRGSAFCGGDGGVGRIHLRDGYRGHAIHFSGTSLRDRLE